MALTIASRRFDDVTILDLNGRITLGPSCAQLRDSIHTLIDHSQKKILLNLGGVNYIDGSGLGELVSLFRSTQNDAASLKLLNLTQKVDGLMQIVKLYTVFDVYDDECAAILSFRDGQHGSQARTAGEFFQDAA